MLWLDLCRAGDCVGTGAAAAGTTLLLELVDLAQSSFVFVVDEMAPGSVGAESDCVECATQFCFVFGMASEGSEFIAAMSKLTLVAIFAVTIFFVWSAQFCLVSTGVHISGVLLVLLILLLLLAQQPLGIATYRLRNASV